MEPKLKKSKKHIVGYPNADTLQNVAAWVQRTELSESSLVIRALEQYFKKHPEPKKV